jgi:predicted MFS family arabinose efflux permease
VERVSLYDCRMTFELIVVVGIIAIAILLFRIEHSLKQANRNLDQIAAALRAKS